MRDIKIIFINSSSQWKENRIGNLYQKTELIKLFTIWVVWEQNNSIHFKLKNFQEFSADWKHI